MAPPIAWLLVIKTKFRSLLEYKLRRSRGKDEASKHIIPGADGAFPADPFIIDPVVTASAAGWLAYVFTAGGAEKTRVLSLSVISAARVHSSNHHQRYTLWYT